MTFLAFFLLGFWAGGIVALALFVSAFLLNTPEALEGMPDRGPVTLVLVILVWPVSLALLLVREVIERNSKP